MQIEALVQLFVIFRLKQNVNVPEVDSHASLATWITRIINTIGFEPGG